MSRISRFHIASLKKLFAVALLCLMCLLLAKVDATAAPAKNVILMISDGQGYNTVQATDYYTGVTPAYETFPTQYGMSTYMLLGDGTPWGYDPVAAWADFNYVKSNPTDSAAAATAIYTGQKTYSGSIGMDFDRESLVSIAQMAATYGKATGAVSSVQFSHATPAAVAAHNISRNNYSQIANEMIYSTDLDVIMGCGHPEFDANGDARLPVEYSYTYVGGESTWLDLRAGTAGGADPWSLIESKADFEALADGTLVLDRVVGVPEVYRTLQYDRNWADPNDDGVYVDPLIATVPSLETMTQGALNVLSADPDGFFVMIEGGAVDWANHGNDMGRMIEEQIDFNDSVQAVVDWVSANSSWDETLLVVTADHETGYLWGPGSGLPATFNPIVDNGAGNLPGYQYNSGGHTNSLVPLYAIGNGSGLFAGVAIGSDPVRGPYVDNTDIFYVVKTAAAIPEPGTIMLISCALVAMAGVVRKKYRSVGV